MSTARSGSNRDSGNRELGCNPPEVVLWYFTMGQLQHHLFFKCMTITFHQCTETSVPSLEAVPKELLAEA